LQVQHLKLFQNVINVKGFGKNGIRKASGRSFPILTDNNEVEKEELTLVFKALSHPERRKILDLLKSGPLMTMELSEQSDVSRFQIMKHLKILESANLVLTRRNGRMKNNYINAVPLTQMYERWVSHYESGMASSLLSLKENLERGNDMVKLKNDSFEIEMEVSIEASKEKVFTALTQDINQWWAYRLGDTSKSKLHFEPKFGGKFYEDWGNGEGAVWGTIYYYKSGEEIRLNGPLGMKGAITSDYTYTLEEKGSTTILKLSHHTSGLLHPEWEEQHRIGWNELLGQFLKEYVETGKIPNQE
jgi:DNA-binding transcriptional ArsR family regulator